LGFSVLTGLSTGLDSMLPQAFGADPNHTSLCRTSQRAVAVLLLVCVPIAVVFTTAPLWLPVVLPADDARVSQLAGVAVRLLAAELPLFAVADVLSVFLVAVGRGREILVGGVAGLVACPLLLYGFVVRGALANVEGAVAMSKAGANRGGGESSSGGISEAEQAGEEDQASPSHDAVWQGRGRGNKS
jgi:Na+-driven multidrug efflux pump